MKQKNIALLVVVAALGYFVDIYDLILFGIVRNPSLTSLGCPPELLKDKGILLLNMQMSGMLVGGILFGILGDTKGRISVLFGSIILYSLANIANGMVTDIPTYAIIRFIAGVGLAGELGAGITLISETMSKEKRGYGTMIVVVFGALGAVLAAMIAKYFDWRTTYYIGGGLGLLLLVMRVGTYESGMFRQVKDQQVKRGAFLSLFTDFKRFRKYLACIFIGLPVWYAVGILVIFSPEFAKVIGVKGNITAAEAIMYTYIGLSAGDLLGSLLSQWFRNRKKVVMGFILSTMLIAVVFLYSRNISVTYFYFLCFALGAGTGFWALFVTIASEQFGTNIRATVTTTVPNFVRGAVVPLTLSFQYLSSLPSVGLINSGLIVGLVSTTLAMVSILSVKETFGKELDYTEPL